MQVISGNTGNVTLNDSTWSGAALDVTNLTVNSSDWNLTANSTITNDLINNGLIDYISEGNIFKTLTVSGAYIGQGGTIGLNTFLEGDGSPSDLLIINGGTATGTTLLNIKNTTGAGALTVGNGILVVDAISGSTTAPGSFSLANYVVAGPYNYNLFRGSVDGTGPQNWYLRSTQIPVLDPDFREEVSLYTALPSLSLLYGRSLLDTLHQRVGEEELLRNRSCASSRSTFNGFWIRYINQGGRQKNGGIFNDGPDFNYHLGAVQGGVDVYRHEFSDGSREHVGVLAAIGTGSGNVKHFDGSHAGKDKFDAYTGGLYWTHFSPWGGYLDAVFQTNWYENMRANSTRDLHLTTHGVGFAGSLETGYPIRLRYFVLEPQAQLVHQSISLHDSADAAATVNFKRTYSTEGRLGVRLADTWSIGCLPSGESRLLSAWFRTSFWHDFQGRSTTLLDLCPLILNSGGHGCKWI